MILGCGRYLNYPSLKDPAPGQASKAHSTPPLPLSTWCQISRFEMCFRGPQAPKVLGAKHVSNPGSVNKKGLVNPHFIYDFMVSGQHHRRPVRGHRRAAAHRAMDQLRRAHRGLLRLLFLLHPPCPRVFGLLLLLLPPPSVLLLLAFPALVFLTASPSVLVFLACVRDRVRVCFCVRVCLLVVSLCLSPLSLFSLSPAHSCCFSLADTPTPLTVCLRVCACVHVQIWFDGGFSVPGLKEKLLALYERTQPNAAVFNGCGLLPGNKNAVIWIGTESGQFFLRRSSLGKFIPHALLCDTKLEIHPSTSQNHV